MNKLTTIAALPGSGAGCMSALPAEKHEQPKSPWWADMSGLGNVRHELTYGFYTRSAAGWVRIGNASEG